MKNVREILNFLRGKNLVLKDKIKGYENIIEDINFDSRLIKNNHLFICKGKHFTKDFLDSAIDNGAKIYISENKYRDDIDYIIVRDIRKVMIELARFFFDYPDKKIKLIGITGTKGKSTTITMLKSILDNHQKNNGKKEIGIISSILTYDGINSFESHLTTPEAIDLYRHIYNAVKTNLEIMIIEISSQALKYDRVGNISLDISAITNIGIDHIGSNEHPNLEDYIQSKLKIIGLSDKFVYNIDAENADRIKEKIKHKDCLTVSIFNDKADIYADNIYNDGINNYFNINNIAFKINLLGDFNVQNALIAVAISKSIGVELTSAAKYLSNKKIISNSEILISNDKNIVSFVNYAHNKISFDANFKMISSLYPEYDIISIFGASGGKGINRRKDLILSAQEYSNKIYLVPDDPNYEDIRSISEEMSDYITKNIDFKIFLTREEAIIKSFKENKNKEIFFIAGKADEKYQLINGQYIEITSDIDVARREMDSYNK